MDDPVTMLATRRVFNSSTGQLYAPGAHVTLPASLLQKGAKVKPEVTDKGGLTAPNPEAVAEIQRQASAPTAPRATIAGTPGGPTASHTAAAAEPKGQPGDAQVKEGGKPRTKSGGKAKDETAPAAEAKTETAPAAEAPVDTGAEGGDTAQAGAGAASVLD